MQNQKEPLSAAKCTSNTLPKGGGAATLAPTQESPAAPSRAQGQSLAILILNNIRAFQGENPGVGGRKEAWCSQIVLLARPAEQGHILTPYRKINQGPTQDKHRTRCYTAMPTVPASAPPCQCLAGTVNRGGAGAFSH